MEPFRQIVGNAASLPDDNVDTDIIFPARFLTITAREGLGAYAFHDRAFDLAGAVVLVAGANFGCGSSREQAVWALLGAGIRCVVAPSFGEIFAANCRRNGVLPVVLPMDVVGRLHGLATAGNAFAVDLEAQTLTVTGQVTAPFAIAEKDRLALLNGWDETAAILARDGDAITAFEHRQQQDQPWLYEGKVR
jgi:3-isopropylmalate/(R)-2-methylmalate dehydratase small subunit